MHRLQLRGSGLDAPTHGALYATAVLRVRRAALRFSIPLGLLLSTLVNGCVTPTPAHAGSIPAVPATATWPASDVPSLLTYQLNQFADLSGKTTEVKAFGATGDGSTDDPAAIQSAINAANNGTLHFPAGVFV